MTEDRQRVDAPHTRERTWISVASARHSDPRVFNLPPLPAAAAAAAAMATNAFLDDDHELTRCTPERDSTHTLGACQVNIDIQQLFFSPISLANREALDLKLRWRSALDLNSLVERMETRSLASYVHTFIKPCGTPKRCAMEHTVQNIL